jgi:hypothetical protein
VELFEVAEGPWAGVVSRETISGCSVGVELDSVLGAGRERLSSHFTRAAVASAGAGRYFGQVLSMLTNWLVGPS